MAVPNNCTGGFGTEDDIAGPDGLARLGKGTQRFGVGPDLLGLTPGQVCLNGMGDLLLHAAVVFRSGSAQSFVQLG